MAPLVVHLPERALITIAGSDAQPFLQGLITVDIDRLQAKEATYGALLTPQGKILFDFFVVREDDRYLIDCARSQREALVKRFQFYKLRAKIDIEPGDVRNTYAVLEGNVPGALRDPRPADIGERLYAQHTQTGGAGGAYHERRTALGFAEGGIDFESGELFPHEANLDQINGISFEKGCFIGQEVVSRMEHRGTARSRILPCRAEGRLPGKGSEIDAGGRTVGRVLSGAGRNVLALLRLDRLADSENAGLALMADGVPLQAHTPAWARFAMGRADSQPK